MIRIITDSSADLPPAYAAVRDIAVLPITVFFTDAAYHGTEDITPAAFYEKLAACETLPTTVQINPDAFREAFAPYLAAGDEIVGLFISREMSGTYQSALMAADMLPEYAGQIHIADTLNTTFGLALLVKLAADARDRGLSGAAIAAEIAALAPRVRLLAMVDTLRYLRMGGRISTAAAFVGGVLGINPIIAVEKGFVVNLGKARGHKACFEWILSKLRENPPDPAYSVTFGYSDRASALEEFLPYCAADLRMDDRLICGIGSTVGTHVGPGAAGVAYIMR